MRMEHTLYAVLATTLLALGATTPVAASETSDERREEMALRLEEIKDRLNLTPEQEEKIRPLFQKRNEQLKALREKHGENLSRRERIAMFREARGIQNEFQEQLRPILTPEQMKEWEALRSEGRSAVRERRRSRG